MTTQYAYFPRLNLPILVSTASALPTPAGNGTLAVALDTGFLYEYNANTPGWQQIGGGGGGSGTVTSVALADASSTPIFGVTGSPITIAGTLSLTLVAQAKNLVFAGPSSGSNAQPTFRSLGLADLPSIGSNTVLGNTTGSSAVPSAVALGTLTEATSSVLTLASWANATVGSPTITVKQAGASQSGYLSTTDWNTFNGKQAAGSYLTALTGDVTASGPGSAAASLVATTNSTLTTLSGLTSAASLATVGTITTGIWRGTAIDATRGGTGISTASSTGVPSILSGVWSVAAQLGAALGGTGISTASSTGVPTILSGVWSVLSTLSVALGGSGAGTLTGLLQGNGTSPFTGLSTLAGNSTYLTAPTIQNFLSTGSTTGFLFTVSSANATAGAVYTNNSHSFTVLYTISTGTTLWCSGASAPTSSGTLTKSSGTGDATITFSANQALASYTVPSGPAPLYIEVEFVAGGGGGAGGSGSAVTQGATGGYSGFAGNLALGGVGGQGNGGSQVPGTGGANATAATGASGTVLHAVNGGVGGAAPVNGGATTTYSVGGGNGGNSFFGGAGGGGPVGGGSAGTPGAANSGSGGGGGGIASGTAGASGSGGGAGAYQKIIISNPSGTYYYTVASGGNGTAGTVSSGGSGAGGKVAVKECYQ